MSKESFLYLRRKRRIRNKIKSLNSGRHRLTVFRTGSHIRAQIISSEGDGSILVSASTLEKSVTSELTHGGNIAAAKKVGMEIARRALEKGVGSIVFDRSGYLYHGRIKAVAEGAREAGLVF